MDRCLVIMDTTLHSSKYNYYILHVTWKKGVCWEQHSDEFCDYNRVESGSDDPDNLGHFFGGSSGSHLQTKLSGCDPDIT